MFRPKYIDLEEDADNLTPENFASFPSKMTFSWFDSFAWTGWKRNFTIYKSAESKKHLDLYFILIIKSFIITVFYLS